MNYTTQTLIDSLLIEPTRAPFDLGDIISRPTSSGVYKASQQDGFPLPHGSTYSDIESLTVDIIKRCNIEGYDLLSSIKFLKQVLKQFDGAPA